MKWLSRTIGKVRRWVERERRRFPRYELEKADDVKAFFSLEGAAAYVHGAKESVEQPHSIINLSRGGVSLFLHEEDDLGPFRMRNKVTLEIYIEGLLMKIPCEVMYVREGLKRVGLRFAEVTEDQLKIIERFLDARFLAHSIKEIPVAQQKRRGQICRWYHGMNNTDLFSWQDRGGEIQHQLFIFIDKVLEWTEQNGLRTGEINHTDYELTQTTLFSRESLPIKFDEVADVGTVEMACSIVELANIDASLKGHFLSSCGCCRGTG